MVILFIGYPFCLLYELFINDETYGTPFYYSISLTLHLFFNPCYWFQIFFTVARFWLIYYDIQFSTSCLNLQWKYCINKTNASYTHNDKWYISHRQMYGNEQYIMRRTTVLCTAVSSVSLATAILYDFRVIALPYHHALCAVILPLVCLILCVLCRKLPEFYDHIYLHKEAKLIAHSWCFLGLCYLLSVAIPVFLNTDLFIFTFLFCLSALCGVAIVPLFSAFWVSWQLKTAEFELADNMLPSIKHSSSRSSLARIELTTILRDKELFHSFMQHVIMEFSLESLLALIEMNQYKQRVVEGLNVTTESQQMENLRWLAFPEDVPLSDIVYGGERETNVAEFKTMAYELYKKYVANGAEFEINIAFKTRKALHGLMKDCNVWTEKEMDGAALAQLFDGCMVEMTALLNGTKLRFKEESVMTTRPAQYLPRMQTIV